MSLTQETIGMPSKMLNGQVDCFLLDQENCDVTLSVEALSHIFQSQTSYIVNMALKSIKIFFYTMSIELINSQYESKTKRVKIIILLSVLLIPFADACSGTFGFFQHPKRPLVIYIHYSLKVSSHP